MGRLTLRNQNTLYETHDIYPGNLIVNGSLVHTSGTISMTGKSKLEIQGNYIEEAGNISYVADKRWNRFNIIVGGDFETKCTSNISSYCDFEILGNIIVNCNTSYVFSPKVNFNGDVIQSVISKSYEVTLSSVTVSNPKGVDYSDCAALNITLVGDDYEITKDASGKITFVKPATPVCEHNYNAYGYCRLCGEAQNGVDGFKGASVTIGGRIEIIYNVSLSDQALSDPDAYMLFTISDSNTKKVKISEAANKGNGLYSFSCVLTSTQMSSNVNAKMVYSKQMTYNEGTEPVSVDYSIETYCKNMLGKTSDDKLKAVLNSMLDYGAYLRIFVGESGVEIQNSLDNMEVTIGEEYNRSVSGTEPAGVKSKGAKVVIDSLMSLSIKYEVTGDINDYTFMIDGNEVTPVLKSDGYYYVTVDEIEPLHYSKIYSFTVSDGTDSSTVTYSPLTYVKNMLGKNTTDTTLRNVCKAIYAYNKAVVVYNV